MISTDRMLKDEYLAWAKKRALANLETGNQLLTFAQFLVDLSRHPQLAIHVDLDELSHQVIIGNLESDEEVKKWIENFGS